MKMVIWLMGISGAGKTTIGRRLAAYYKEQNIPHYLLDSDELRDLFDRDLGYEYADRVANLKRVITAAYVLEKNNIITIVCNVSHLEDIRQLARLKLSDYHEIYLRKDVKRAIEEDHRGIYKSNAGITPMVGIDVAFENPTNPDLILDTDVLNDEETFNCLKNYISRSCSNE